MIHCYLGLGSNLDDPKTQIHTAIAHLNLLPNTKLIQASPLYKSIPAHVPNEQPMYYNAVAYIHTTLPPETLIKHCRMIEAQQKRIRLRRADARTIDVDILLYGKESVQKDDLVIPHPRLHLRDFVLVPLLDIWPDAHLPNGVCLKNCLDALQTRYITSVPACLQQTTE